MGGTHFGGDPYCTLHAGDTSRYKRGRCVPLLPPKYIASREEALAPRGVSLLHPQIGVWGGVPYTVPSQKGSLLHPPSLGGCPREGLPGGECPHCTPTSRGGCPSTLPSRGGGGGRSLPPPPWAPGALRLPGKGVPTAHTPPPLQSGGGPYSTRYGLPSPRPTPPLTSAAWAASSAGSTVWVRCSRERWQTTQTARRSCTQ